MKKSAVLHKTVQTVPWTNVSAYADVFIARGYGAEGTVYLETIVGTPMKDQSFLTVKLTVIRQDDLGDQYQPTRWSFARPNGTSFNAETLKEGLDVLCKEAVEAIELRLLHPEAFATR